MDAREFLDFGLKLNEDDEFRLDFLKPLLEKQPESPERDALMRAFKRRKSRRTHYIFDAELRSWSGDKDDNMRAIRVLLLIQELTRQLCEKDSLGQKRPQRDWRLTATLITHWDLD